MKSRSFSWVPVLFIVGAMLFSTVQCAPQAATETAVPAATEAPTTAAATAAPTEAPTATPDKEAPVTEGPQSVLRVPRGQIDNLDPGLLPSVNDCDIQSKMFEGLLDFMVDGTEVKLGAESYEVNETGDVYTFHLRKNAKWSDGQPLTAHDYVYSWRRVQDPVTASGYASFAYIIKNAAAINSGEIEDLTQLGVEAVDDYTLKVTLEQTATFFPRVVAFNTLFPVRQDVIEKYGDKWLEPENIVSNGPYVMTEWEKDVQVVFERNPHYWGEPPKVAKIVYKLMENPASTAPTMYEAGELDLALFPPEEYARINDDPVLSKEVVLQTSSSIMFIVFDSKYPPFNDVRVRQAFNLAIDRESYVKGPLQGLYEPAYILIPPGIAGRNEDASLSSRDYAKDVERAKELMAEAGYPNGEGFPEVELKYRTRENEQKMGEAIPPMWEKALGVKVKRSPTEAQAYREWFRSRKTEPFDMMVYGWASDYEDPYDYFNTIWPSWSDLYMTKWVHEEYDALAKEAGLVTDPEKRVEMYMKVDEILESEGPMAPVNYGSATYLVKPWVRGQILNRMGAYTLQYAWVVPH
jgi:oligopeptide transport system substrate-binding protein